MIPTGYIDGLVAWATLPTLSADEKTARGQALLGEFEALVTGQVTGRGKTSQSLLSGNANGKSFTFDANLTKPEKIVVLTAVLERLGLLAGDYKLPRGSYANFSCIER